MKIKNLVLLFLVFNTENFIQAPDKTTQAAPSAKTQTLTSTTSAPTSTSTQNASSINQAQAANLIFAADMPTTSQNETIIDQIYGGSGLNIASQELVRIKNCYCYLEFLVKLNKVQTDATLTQYMTDFQSFLPSTQQKAPAMPTQTLVQSNGWKAITVTSQDIIASTMWQTFLKAMICETLNNDAEYIIDNTNVQNQIFPFIPNIEMAHATDQFKQLYLYEESIQLQAVLQAHQRQQYLAQCTDWQNMSTADLITAVSQFKKTDFYTALHTDPSTKSSPPVIVSPTREQIVGYFMLVHIQTTMYALISQANLSAILAQASSTTLIPNFFFYTAADYIYLNDVYALQNLTTMQKNAPASKMTMNTTPSGGIVKNPPTPAPAATPAATPTSTSKSTPVPVSKSTPAPAASTTSTSNVAKKSPASSAPVTPQQAQDQAASFVFKDMPTTSTYESVIDTIYGASGLKIAADQLANIKKTYCYLEFLIKLNKVQTDSSYAQYKKDFQTFLVPSPHNIAYVPTQTLVTSAGWNAISVTSEDFIESPTWQNYIKIMICDCYDNHATFIINSQATNVAILSSIPSIEDEYATPDFTQLRLYLESIEMEELIRMNELQQYLQQCPDWAKLSPADLATAITQFKTTTFYDVTHSTLTQAPDPKTPNKYTNMPVDTKDQVLAYYLLITVQSNVYALLTTDNLLSFLTQASSASLTPNFFTHNLSNFINMYDFLTIKDLIDKNNVIANAIPSTPTDDVTVQSIHNDIKRDDTDNVVIQKVITPRAFRNAFDPKKNGLDASIKKTNKESADALNPKTNGLSASVAKTNKESADARHRQAVKTRKLDKKILKAMKKNETIIIAVVVTVVIIIAIVAICVCTLGAASPAAGPLLEVAVATDTAAATSVAAGEGTAVGVGVGVGAGAGAEVGADAGAAAAVGAEAGTDAAVGGEAGADAGVAAEAGGDAGVAAEAGGDAGVAGGAGGGGGGISGTLTSAANFIGNATGINSLIGAGQSIYAAGVATSEAFAAGAETGGVIGGLSAVGGLAGTTATGALVGAAAYATGSITGALVTTAIVGTVAVGIAAGADKKFGGEVMTDVMVPIMIGMADMTQGLTTGLVDLSYGLTYMGCAPFQAMGLPVNAAQQADSVKAKMNAHLSTINTCMSVAVTILITIAVMIIAPYAAVAYTSVADAGWFGASAAATVAETSATSASVALNASTAARVTAEQELAAAQAAHDAQIATDASNTTQVSKASTTTDDATTAANTTQTGKSATTGDESGANQSTSIKSRITNSFTKTPKPVTQADTEAELKAAQANLKQKQLLEENNKEIATQSQAKATARNKVVKAQNAYNAASKAGFADDATKTMLANNITTAQAEADQATQALKELQAAQKAIMVSTAATSAITTQEEATTSLKQVATQMATKQAADKTAATAAQDLIAKQTAEAAAQATAKETATAAEAEGATQEEQQAAQAAAQNLEKATADRQAAEITAQQTKDQAQQEAALLTKAKATQAHAQAAAKLAANNATKIGVTQADTTTAKAALQSSTLDETTATSAEEVMNPLTQGITPSTTADSTAVNTTTESTVTDTTTNSGAAASSSTKITTQQAADNLAEKQAAQQTAKETADQTFVTAQNNPYSVSAKIAANKAEAALAQTQLDLDQAEITANLAEKEAARDAAAQSLQDANNSVKEAQAALSENPSDPDLQAAVKNATSQAAEKQTALDAANADLNQTAQSVTASEAQRLAARSLTEIGEEDGIRAAIKSGTNTLTFIIGQALNAGFTVFSAISSAAQDQAAADAIEQEQKSIQSLWGFVEDNKVSLVQSQNLYMDELHKKHQAAIENQAFGLQYYTNYLNGPTDQVQNQIAQALAQQQVQMLTPDNNGLITADIGSSWGLQTQFDYLYPAQGFTTTTLGRTDFPYAQEVAQAPLASQSSAAPTTTDLSDNQPAATKLWFNQRAVATLNQAADKALSVEIKFRVLYNLNTAYHVGLYLGGNYHDYNSAAYLQSIQDQGSIDLDEAHLAKMFVLKRDDGTSAPSIGLYENEGLGWITQAPVDPTMINTASIYHMSANLNKNQLTISFWPENNPSTKWTKTVQVTACDQRTFGVIFSGIAIEWGVVQPTVAIVQNQTARSASNGQSESDREKASKAQWKQLLNPKFGSMTLQSPGRPALLQGQYLYTTQSTGLLDGTGSPITDYVVFATATGNTVNNIGASPAPSDPSQTPNAIVSLITGNVYNATGSIITHKQNALTTYAANSTLISQSLIATLTQQTQAYQQQLLNFTFGTYQMTALSSDAISNGLFIYTCPTTITTTDASGNPILDYLIMATLVNNSLGSSIGMPPSSSIQGMISLITGNVYGRTSSSPVDSGYSELTQYTKQYGQLQQADVAAITNATNAYNNSIAAQAQATQVTKQAQANVIASQTISLSDLLNPGPPVTGGTQIGLTSNAPSNIVATPASISQLQNSALGTATVQFGGIGPVGLSFGTAITPSSASTTPNSPNSISSQTLTTTNQTQSTISTSVTPTAIINTPAVTSQQNLPAAPSANATPSQPSNPAPAASSSIDYSQFTLVGDAGFSF